MSWLNLNQSLNSLKGQITNFASEVLSEGVPGVSGDEAASTESPANDLEEKCKKQEEEIAALKKLNEELQTTLQSEVKMSEEASSRQNGTNGARLAPSKPPRDLSLGRIKLNKKVFIPNLNVTRNKKGTPGAASGSKQHKHDNRKDRHGKRDRNRNQRNTPEIIKSSGVFSQGVGSGERLPGGRPSYGREDFTTLQRPVIKVKDFGKLSQMDKELEEQQGGGGSGTGEGMAKGYWLEVEDFRGYRDRDIPIRLPVDDGTLTRPLPKSVVKEEVVIKTELGDGEPIDVKSLVGVKLECEDFNNPVVQLMRTTEPTLVLIKLPGPLAGYDESEIMYNQCRVNEEPRPASATDDMDDAQPQFKYKLYDQPEGMVGRVRVHRSGRVTIALGHDLLDVNTTTKSPLYQEIVSVVRDDMSLSANIVSLGQLHHKLILVPQWDRLVKAKRNRGYILS